MILHTLNASPSSAVFGDCLDMLHAGDALLLLGDGVYAALPGPRSRLGDCGAELYLLEADARAAGISVENTAIKVIDMSGFVELSERFPRQQAWF